MCSELCGTLLRLEASLLALRGGPVVLDSTCYGATLEPWNGGKGNTEHCHSWLLRRQESAFCDLVVIDGQG